MNNLTTTTEFELTPCQHAAAVDILNWAHDDDRLFMTLAGPAGTGKSWLSKFILQNLRRHTVCVSAPTHKALKEVKKASGFPGKTLQSLLGLAVNQDIEDFDPVNIKFDRYNKPTISDYDLILLDEASMVQIALREYLQELCVEHKTKVLFVGDPIQLPPVRETVSTVFQQQYIDGGVVYLSTPCRQSASNPAYSLLLADRNDIEQSNASWNVLINHLKEQSVFTEDLHVKLATNHKNTYKVVRDHLGKRQINNEGEGYKIYSDPKEFIKQMNKTFVDYLKDGNFDGVRALAWTNTKVGEFNKFIRKTLFPTIVDDITPGDLLMCYRPVTAWDSVSRKQYTLIHNSEEVMVTGTQQMRSGIGLNIYSSLVETLNKNEKEMHDLDFVHPSSYKEYIEQFRHYKSNAKQRGWKAFYGFYDNHLLLDNLAKKFDNKYLPNKAFDYAYALTVHKSQGSTFNEVFIDINDIYYHYTVNKSILQQQGAWNDATARTYQRITRQLRYVAASRAKKFTHFLI